MIYQITKGAVCAEIRKKEGQKIVGYKADGRLINEPQNGGVYTRAFVFCSKCNDPISSQGGPMYGALCTKCYSKIYPLEIENIGGDTYILISQGHHDLHSFMRKVREDGYDWPLGVPEHCYMKTIPTPNSDNTICLYEEAAKDEEGAWPCTFVGEACYEESYEAKFPNPPTETE